MGLEAISAVNGWAMALIGGLIVMTGLAVLSFIISQLHKLVAILEKESQGNSDKSSAIDQKINQKQESTDLLSDVNELKKIYKPLIQKLDQPFQLSELYDLSEKNRLPHTHLTIKMLRQEGVLAPAGDGAFTWNQ